jgi:hypothetical protein
VEKEIDYVRIRREKDTRERVMRARREVEREREREMSLKGRPKEREKRDINQVTFRERYDQER